MLCFDCGLAIAEHQCSAKKVLSDPCAATRVEKEIQVPLDVSEVLEEPVGKTVSKKGVYYEGQGEGTRMAGTMVAHAGDMGIGHDKLPAARTVASSDSGPCPHFSPLHRLLARAACDRQFA